MSILRQFNFLGQERLDVVHFRSIESSIAADADVLVGRALAVQKPLVVRGFNLAIAGAIGAPATNLQVVVADGIIFNLNATESGTFFWVPANRAPEILNSSNPNVTGSFTAAQTNYIGVDLIRSADTTTSDLVKFLDANTLLEISKNVPLGRTLNYRFVISTSAFSTQPNICPIAKVITNSSNIVTSIVDARNLMFRLGSGGDFPNRSNAFSFPGGRNEDTVTDFFAGGDKANQGFKDWADMMMTRLWEIGGGERWYGPTADRNVKMVENPATVFADGDNFEFIGGNLHWQGLSILFDNSNSIGTFSNDIADQTTNSPGLTDLAVGQCIYVDLDRTQTLTGGSALVAVKTNLQALGTPVTPGSRFIIAWRNSFGVFTRDNRFPVNTTFAPATTTSLGAVELTYAAGTPATPKVAPQDVNGSILNTATGGNGSGFLGTGIGTGSGLVGTGGSSSGNGVAGTGGGPNGNGTSGTGIGTGAGGVFSAGATGAGVIAVGFGGSLANIVGAGLVARGAPGLNADGIVAFGGTTNSNGVTATGAGTGQGLHGTGGSQTTSGIGGAGIIATGGAATSAGTGQGGKGAVLTAGTSSPPATATSSGNAGNIGAVIAASVGADAGATSGTGGLGGIGTTVTGGNGGAGPGNTATGGTGGVGATINGGTGGTGGVGAGAAAFGGIGGIGLIVNGGNGGVATGSTDGGRGAGAAGIVVTGGGAGASGPGFPTGGTAIIATGGTFNGVGINATGVGSGTGIIAQGGSSLGTGLNATGGGGGTGVIGTGGSTGGDGVVGNSGGTGNGVLGNAGSTGTNAPNGGSAGVRGVSTGASLSSGVVGFTSSSNSQAGVVGYTGSVGAGNSGVYGVAATSADGGNTGAGITGDGDGFGGASSGSYGVIARGPGGATPTRSAFRIVPQQLAPSNLQDGDIWVQGGTLWVRLAGVTRSVNVT